MERIKVTVHGILGKMGGEVARAVSAQSDMKFVGAADALAQNGAYNLPDDPESVPLSASLADIVADSDVVVDFTNSEGAMSALRTATARNVNVVVGSTGLTETDLKEAEDLAQVYGVGVIVVPNFALGAVVMTHLAKVAARFFDYVDLTEMHHEAKIDAPSGTALAIARAAVEGKGGDFASPKAEKETLAGTRGGVHGGVNVHSARMPGRMAHHELVFGTLGQTLTIRHDSINRESFMPGVLIAVRQAVKSKGLTVGLDQILGL